MRRFAVAVLDVGNRGWAWEVGCLIYNLDSGEVVKVVGRAGNRYLLRRMG